MDIIEVRDGAHSEAVRRLLTTASAELDSSLSTRSIHENWEGGSEPDAAPHFIVLLAMDRGEAIGCFGLARAGEGAGALSHLYVVPTWRRRGVGRRLCEVMMDRAREAGFRRLLLSARASWTPAVTLFRSLGFTPSDPVNAVKRADWVTLGRDVAAPGVSLTARDASPTEIYKVSGNDLDDSAFATALAGVLAARWKTGTRLALVHGGGKELTELLTALQIPTRFSDGLRVTTRQGRDAALMVLSGLANKRLVAAILREGVTAVGLSGIDAGLVQVERINDELQYVGKPISVRASVIDACLDNRWLPVIAPMSLGVDGEIYNVNADHVAGALAVAVGAQLLTFMTNVPGVLNREMQLIETLTAPQTENLIADGTISGGMIPKVKTCLEALAAGVTRVRITNLAGVGAGTGTVFVHSASRAPVDAA